MSSRPSEQQTNRAATPRQELRSTNINKMYHKICVKAEYSRLGADFLCFDMQKLFDIYKRYAILFIVVVNFIIEGVFMIDCFLQTADEIKSGISYDSDNKSYTCLICGKTFEDGEVYPAGGRFFTAPRAAELHIQSEHGEMFDRLISYDKKYTGLTENQTELLKLIHEGLSDKEIAQKFGTAAATVRHQRFILREKAKQAKLYLSIFELADSSAGGKKKKDTSEEFIEMQSNAKMVDDRYFITKAEEDKIITAVFSSTNPLKLKVFSSKEKKKIVILKKIASQFEPDRKYSEKEVNAIIKDIYDDYATVRRYLIEYGFMARTNDCTEYWRK